MASRVPYTQTLYPVPVFFYISSGTDISISARQRANTVFVASTSLSRALDRSSSSGSLETTRQRS